MTFGAYLRILRNRSGIAAAEVDRRAELPVNACSRMERGKIPPPRTEQEIARIASAVGVSPEGLRAKAIEHHVPKWMREALGGPAVPGFDAREAVTLIGDGQLLALAGQILPTVDSLGEDAVHSLVRLLTNLPVGRQAATLAALADVLEVTK